MKLATFFFIAGEPSGDLHGAKFIEALSKRLNGAQFRGIGGPKMRASGLKIDPIPTESLSVMGITAVLKKLPSLFRSFYQVKQAILKQDPDCVVLIDYPGFNLRLLRSLRKAGYKKKIVYAIAPSVWAHGKKRADLLRRFCDLLLVIYPFELDYFKGMPCRYIGNPLTEDLENETASPRKGIALFPGSRRSEIELNLSLMIQSLEKLFVKRPGAFECEPISVSVANEYVKPLIEQQLKKSILPFELIKAENAKKLMQTHALYLATSGTVTLELALAKAKAVVIYKIPKLLYLIGKYIARIKLPFFCIVNILMRREVYKEFFSKEIDSDAVVSALLKLHDSTKVNVQLDQDFEEIAALMGKSDPSASAAESILDLLEDAQDSHRDCKVLDRN